MNLIYLLKAFLIDILYLVKNIFNNFILYFVRIQVSGVRDYVSGIRDIGVRD